ncbi:TPA: hypothetical protein P2Q89_003827 [Aeromonas veronii]|nr:hypothetical protein [Aeromonas veronii]
MKSIKQIPSKNIIPLEYCTIDRAARLLDCEVEDLIHWGSIGAVKLFILFDAVDLKTYEVLFPVGQVGNLDLDHGASFIEVDKEKRITTPSLGTKNFQGRAIISGFWSVSYSSMQYWEIYGTKENHTPGMISRVDACYRDGSGVARALFPDGYTPDKVWLMRSDLEMLNRHIQKGEQLAIRERLPDAESGSRWAYTPHPTAEHHATKREAVLAAAIYAKKAWLNECGTTYVAWATAISNHEATLFDEGKAPLSIEIMAKLLSSAMKTGKVPKS